MRNNILTLLVGFVVMLGSIMLFKIGLDKMTSASASPTDSVTNVDVDLHRKAILYRVKSGDTLWSIAQSFYGRGNRWSDIAAYNELSETQGIEAGSIIKIPLANDSTHSNIVADNAETGLDSTPLGLPSSAFGIGDDTVSMILCRIDNDAFPTGAVCVATTNEQERIRVSLFDAINPDGTAPAATYIAPKGDLLRHMDASDMDGDGQDEIFTVWQTTSDDCTSRILKYGEGGLEVLSETPQDPIAVLRLRNQGQ